VSFVSRLSLIILMSVLALSSAGCDDSSSASPSASSALQGTLTLTGSSTVAPLAMEIGRRFETLHPGVRVDVQTGGSSRGIGDARNGTADIGMASRALKGDELSLNVFQIASDGIGIIVHRENPIRKITAQQVADIYTGRITNWNQLGGHDAKITVVHKADGRATQKVFLKHFQMHNADVKPHVVIGDNQQGIKTVINDVNAVSYVSIGAADYEARHGAALRLLPLDGVTPSLANVSDGQYPIARPLNLITRDRPTGLVKAFIDYATSKDVLDLVEAQTFVPATP